MIDKSFIEKILEINKPQEIEVGERKYFDRGLVPVKDPEPTFLDVQTLTGLVDFINASPNENYLLHVQNELTVDLTTKDLRGAFLQRPIYVRAIFAPPNIPFGTFSELETFLTQLQSLFEADSERDALYNLLSHITDGAVATSDDNGMSQTVTVKAGAAIRDAEEVPNPVRLTPYRTFPEITQPESPFIVRLRSARNSEEGKPTVGLFEADGGAWRNSAIILIRDWLSTATGENVPIVA